MFHVGFFEFQSGLVQVRGVLQVIATSLQSTHIGMDMLRWRVRFRLPGYITLQRVNVGTLHKEPQLNILKYTYIHCNIQNKWDHLGLCNAYMG